MVEDVPINLVDANDAVACVSFFETFRSILPNQCLGLSELDRLTRVIVPVVVACPVLPVFAGIVPITLAIVSRAISEFLAVIETLPLSHAALKIVAHKDGDDPPDLHLYRHVNFGGRRRTSRTAAINKRTTLLGSGTAAVAVRRPAS